MLFFSKRLSELDGRVASSVGHGVDDDALPAIMALAENTPDDCPRRGETGTDCTARLHSHVGKESPDQQDGSPRVQPPVSGRVLCDAPGGGASHPGAEDDEVGIVGTAVARIVTARPGPRPYGCRIVAGVEEDVAAHGFEAGAQEAGLRV